jgi:acylphosphatase
MEDKQLYKIRVSGHVQGVGFRWSAASEARSLGINGYVKNLPDGSVYIEAEGTEMSVTRFIEWCKKGPSFGFVDTVIFDKSPLKNYKDFRIEH